MDLTGQIQTFEDLAEDDYISKSPRFQGENFQKNIELVNIIKQVAKEKDCTASQLALAWLLSQGHDIVPIPGTKRRKYLEENIGAVNIILSEEEMADINELASIGVASGLRYHEAGMKGVNL